MDINTTQEESKEKLAGETYHEQHVNDLEETVQCIEEESIDVSDLVEIVLYSEENTNYENMSEQQINLESNNEENYWAGANNEEDKESVLRNFNNRLLSIICPRGSEENVSSIAVPKVLRFMKWIEGDVKNALSWIEQIHDSTPPKWQQQKHLHADSIEELQKDLLLFEIEEIRLQRISKETFPLHSCSIDNVSYYPEQHDSYDSFAELLSGGVWFFKEAREYFKITQRCVKDALHEITPSDLRNSKKPRQDSMGDCKNRVLGLNESQGDYTHTKERIQNRANYYAHQINELQKELHLIEKSFDLEFPETPESHLRFVANCEIIDKQITVLENWVVSQLNRMQQFLKEIELITSTAVTDKQGDTTSQIKYTNEEQQRELRETAMCKESLLREANGIGEIQPQSFASCNQRPKVMDVSVISTLNKYKLDVVKPLSIDRLEEDEDGMVVIGPNRTRIAKSAIESINWSLSGAAITRKILVEVFGRETLASHNLTGKPSPAFIGINKPKKNQLDPLKVADVTHMAMQCTQLTRKQVRNIIAAKCADENKWVKKQLVLPNNTIENGNH